MKMNHEKTSGVMGLVVSVLLHGIFFAGCFALDAASSNAHQGQAQTPTESNTAPDAALPVSPHS